MPVGFSENRIRGRVNRMLLDGADDKAILDEIKKRNAGLDPATLMIVIQLVMALIKAFRNRKKAKTSQRKRK